MKDATLRTSLADFEYQHNVTLATYSPRIADTKKAQLSALKISMVY